MGVDSPLDCADRVWVICGVHRPPEEYVKVNHNILARYSETLGSVAEYVERFGKLKQGVVGGGYLVLERDRVWVYTSWDYKYDIHILVQVLGRWFLLPLRIIHVSQKHFQGLARTPFYSLEPMGSIHYSAPTLYIGENGEELYNPKEVTGGTGEPGIDPSKRIRHVLGSERSICNSLRYIRKQARYGNTTSQNPTNTEQRLLT